MKYLLAFGIYVQIVVVVAWLLAWFFAWWIGILVATVEIAILAVFYLREIAENYILD